MPSVVVDVEMPEGNGISARIDLNLHLAPPAGADFLRLGPEPGMEGEQPPRPASQDQGERLQRRILPRFGPGIHGVFLDLHPEGEGGEGRIRPAVFSSEAHWDSQSGLPPLPRTSPFSRHLNRIRRYSPRPRDPSSVGRLEGISRRLFQEPRGQLCSDCGRDKAPVKEEDSSSRGELLRGDGGSDHFECNVCLELAIDPVVTICGHLFCWSCLYQWIYIHSINEECPVCKGSLEESSIIPIYGRGGSSADREQQLQQQDDGSRLPIPPRPRARRIDNTRQQMEAELAEVAAEFEEQDRINFNEMVRMRRVVRFLHDNMSSRYRRRMAERRARLEPTAAATNAPSAAEPIAFALGEFESRAASFQDDYVRQFSASRAETEDRVNSIRARLASLVETIESHRRQAASMAARFSAQQHSAAAAAAAAAANSSSWQASSFSVIATAETIERAPSSASNSSRREAEEGSTSGSGDIDSDVLHSRKRRRLS